MIEKEKEIILTVYREFILMRKITMNYIEISDKNRKIVNDFIINQWYSTKIIVRGKEIDISTADGIMVEENDEIKGLVTYILNHEICEIMSLDSIDESRGIGTTLVNKVIDIAREHGCKKIVLITTNDNINAIRFYQKRGLDMVQIYHNALDISRKLKPEIPLIGDNNIPLKHEIEFEMILSEKENGNMTELTIKANEIDKAISVMREVATWGRKKGLKVWLDEWLTKEELITKDASEENFYIGNIEDDCACAFILQWSDSLYWPQAKEYEAAYIHKLCVRRKYAHMNMTKKVVECVKNECMKRGVRYIRLDTNLDEKVVRQIYLNNGFKIVKIIDYDNGKSMALYEMEV